MSLRSGRLIMLCLGLLILSGCVAYVPPPAHAPEPPPPPPPPPRPHMDVEINYFHDALDPWGDWVWISPHGWVWAPGAIDPFWRPYTVGRWIWSDHGWMWVSDEEWGWATYHYGRWARVPRHGWIWIPGTVWGPAWVAWRRGPGVLGWAPLPPEVEFRAGFGIDVGHVDLDVVIRPDWWCFVDDVRILEPRVVRHAWPVGRNVTVIRRTTRVVVIEERNGRVFHRGVDRDDIERVVRRPLPRYRVVDRDDGPEVRGRRAEIRQDEVRVWRPAVREASDRRPPRRAFGGPDDRTPPASGRDRQDRQPPPPPGHAREERQAPPAAPDREDGRDRRPPPQESVQREPVPLPPAPPPVERRIERQWERDWRRMQENRRREQQQRRRPGAAVSAESTPPPVESPKPPSGAASPARPPSGSAEASIPPAGAAPGRRGASGPPHGLEQERVENQEAAENAYKEQQAQRARAQRESEKPRSRPKGLAARVRGQKDKQGDANKERKEKE